MVQTDAISYIFISFIDSALEIGVLAWKVIAYLRLL